MKADDKAAAALTASCTSRRRFLAGMAGMLIAARAAHAAHRAEDLLNKRAPDFRVVDLNGQPLRLSSFRGKVVLLNFWATWCAPCLVEMPIFSSWKRQYGPRGFKAIGISMDDGAPPARRVADRLKLDYPIAMCDERLAALYGDVLGLPLTFLIDRDGVVRARFRGETDSKIIENRVLALLAQPWPRQ